MKKEEFLRGFVTNDTNFTPEQELYEVDRMADLVKNAFLLGRFTSDTSKPEVKAALNYWRNFHDYHLFDEIAHDKEQFDILIDKMIDSDINISNFVSLLKSPDLPAFKILLKGEHDTLVAFRPTVLKDAYTLENYLSGDRENLESASYVESLLEVFISTHPNKDRADLVLIIGRYANEKPNGKDFMMQVYTEVGFSRNPDFRTDSFAKFAQEFGIDMLVVYLAVQYAVSNRPEIIHEKSRHETSVFIPDPKNPKKRPKREVKLVRNLYLDNSTIDLIKPKRVYTCESWGVIGHERHLKDGRIVKVRPYKKGPKRNEPEAYSPKSYEVADP